MNETNARLVGYFITFSMGWTTGTLISQIFINGFVKETAIIALVLIAISTVLFITRSYEDDNTKILRMFKESSDAEYHARVEIEKKKGGGV